jgi:hypothetical protein
VGATLEDKLGDLQPKAASPPMPAYRQFFALPPRSPPTSMRSTPGSIRTSSSIAWSS